MEKVLKRAAQKAKQAEKSLAKRLKLAKNSREFDIRMNRQATKRYESSLYVDERKRRHEQWTRGPLAAKRDIGPDAKFYGTFDTQHFAFQKEFDARKPDWFHIVEGDRVVVVRGRDAGKIGEVMTLSKENCSVRVKGCNQMEIKVPDLLKDSVGGQDLVATERELPMKDVKLVFPLQDPTTGVTRDTIIDQLVDVGRAWDRHKREYTDGERVIAGTNIIIPWPEKVDPEEQDFEADTRSDLVDQVTFRPQLLTAPMPLKLIDELRNKYSRFRVRHTYDFVRGIEEKAAQELRRKDLIKTMQTPLQEVAELRAKMKRENRQELTNDQISLIREVMAGGRIDTQQSVGLAPRESSASLNDL